MVNHADGTKSEPNFLRGFVAEEPRFSHESHGTEYETFPLSVPRLSGASDRLNVLADRATLAALDLAAGDKVELTGEVRSFNNRSGTGSPAGDLRVRPHAGPRRGGPRQRAGAGRRPVQGAPLPGAPPWAGTSATCCWAVNRRYGRADYLPCIAWGSLALACGELSVGARLHLEGRLQSRVYHKEENGVRVPHTAYEVSIMTLTTEPECGSQR